MMRKSVYVFLSCFLLSGCGMIDYHPYDVRISGETEVNAHNIERIEANWLWATAGVPGGKKPS